MKESGGVMASRRSGGARQTEGGVGQQRAPVLSGAPLADQDQGMAAVGTAPGGGGPSVGLGSGSWANCWGLGRRLPGGLLSGGKERRDFEQGAHAFELGASARMQPAKAAHAMEAAGQDVLEEATEELEGLQVDGLPGAGAAVAKGPAQRGVSAGSDRRLAPALRWRLRLAGQHAQCGMRSCATAEIALLQQTAPPRMPIPPPAA